MKSVFTILYSTRSALDYLDNQSELELNIKSLFLFFFYGQIVYFKNVNVDEKMIHPFIDMLVIIAFVLFIGTLFSLILHKINSWIGGTASYSDVFAIISHATIPITISLIALFFIKYLLFPQLYFNSRIVFYISLLFGFKIITQGFLKHNNSKYFKTLLNMSPLILFYLSWLLIFEFDIFRFFYIHID